MCDMQRKFLLLLVLRFRRMKIHLDKHNRLHRSRLENSKVAFFLKVIVDIHIRGPSKGWDNWPNAPSLNETYPWCRTVRLPEVLIFLFIVSLLKSEPEKSLSRQLAIASIQNITVINECTWALNGWFLVIYCSCVVTEIHADRCCAEFHTWASIGKKTRNNTKLNWQVHFRAEKISIQTEVNWLTHP